MPKIIKIECGFDKVIVKALCIKIAPFHCHRVIVTVKLCNFCLTYIRYTYVYIKCNVLLYCCVEEYVTCHTCRSPETILQKDTRLYFLQCETCGSRCSVASIKSGFQAVTGKRAAMRAKTA